MHGAECALSGEHHGGATSPKPGIVVRAIGTDDATNGHKETVYRTIAISNAPSPDVLSLKAVHSKIIPESRSRSKHKLAQGPHNTVRAGTVLENGHGSYISIEHWRHCTASHV